MPRNIEDVIVPERRKSIRNIPIPQRERSPRKAVAKPSVESVQRISTTPEVDDELSSMPKRLDISHRSKRSTRRRLWLSVGVSALILIFAILSLFNGATIAYIPRSAELNFDNETYTARKTGEAGLIYSVVKLSGDKGVEVPVSGEQQVERKASGTIIVYNDASAEPQRLIENTRFESPTGKIYRIKDAISIPGKRVVGGVSQPGSLEVMVYADVAGDEYNTEPTDFTVPGLKGTPRYSTIYARSKSPITGGFVGKEKVVSEADAARVKGELQATLSEELLAKAQAEVPADFILFPALSSITFEDLPQSASSGSKATVNMRGHLYGIMFKRSDLARELASKKAEVSSEDTVQLNSFDGLKVSFAGAPPADLLPLNEINFRVSGGSILLWQTDEVALKADVLGKKKSDIPNILRNYPTISSATATVRPFWKSSIPNEASKVSVKELSVK